MGETEIAVNLSHCLANKSFLGYTEYYNICTGKWLYTLSWTNMDWVGSLFLLVLAVVVFAMLLGIIIMVATDL